MKSIIQSGNYKVKGIDELDRFPNEKTEFKNKQLEELAYLHNLVDDENLIQVTIEKNNLKLLAEKFCKSANDLGIFKAEVAVQKRWLVKVCISILTILAFWNVLLLFISLSEFQITQFERAGVVALILYTFGSQFRLHYLFGDFLSSGTDFKEFDGLLFEIELKVGKYIDKDHQHCLAQCYQWDENVYDGELANLQKHLVFRYLSSAKSNKVFEERLSLYDELANWGAVTKKWLEPKIENNVQVPSAKGISDKVSNWLTYLNAVAVITAQLMGLVLVSFALLQYLT